MILDWLIQRPSLEEMKRARKLRDDIYVQASDTKIIEMLIKMYRKEGKDTSELKDLWMDCKKFRIENDLPVF